MPNPISFSLPFRLNRLVEPALESWERDDRVRRLWSADPSLWTGADEAKWMGWLSIVNEQLDEPARFVSVSDDAKSFRSVILIGMGGSSLCPEVLARTYGSAPGSPALIVLDSTDPDRIRRVENAVRLEETLIVVSSKSGTTLESSILLDYFLARLSEEVGPENVGSHVTAITDPGSKLEARAIELGFRHLFLGVPEIGGRFSALSDYGMIPAALLGMDVPRFLQNARTMAEACSAAVSAARNPAVALGLALGVAAEEGVDKLSLIVSPPISSFGAWLEQLIAESLGKEGHAVIPVTSTAEGHPDASPARASDRIFVYLRLGEGDSEQDALVGGLEEDGRSVIRIDLPTVGDLAQEFFRWEMATAVAGSQMRLNPFDQPDVEATKTATRRLMDAYEQSGALPEETPAYEDESVAVFGEIGEASTLEECLGHHLHLGENDYVALLAYLEMSEAYMASLGEIRRRIQSAFPNAVTIGFGPRFLHSTGQAHKGGPNKGVFLVLTRDYASDLEIPGRPYSFGLVIGAQARGDCAALIERGRRVLRIHLKADAAASLRVLEKAFDTAIGSTGPNGP